MMDAMPGHDRKVQRQKVFIAGASGVIGMRLCRLLVKGGWPVTGATRSEDKVPQLRALGVMPCVVDVFDATALQRVVVEAEPGIVVHQLTDLPDALDPMKMEVARVRNTRIRDIGTRNLIAAAMAAGAGRLIVQSIAFAYADGKLPHTEDDPLNLHAGGSAGLSAHGVSRLESQVLAAPIDSVVLRYGKLYGPGTGFELPPAGGPLHADAAADAARRALTRGHGIYNIAEADGTVSILRAITDLDWDPDYRLT